ncbi:hypothetical protein [Streptomyces griseoviridis]|uniref:hypothetical protein n=1 Tax=Streptomyces griseoviridis TaxID=45398 RepID=UPI003455FFA7
MNNKVVLPVATLASAAVAFGLGAMIFTNGNAPATVATPQPTTTVTASPKPGSKAADVHEKSTTATEATGTTTKATETTKAAQAGEKGPFKDAQGDGKHLDDFGKAVMPNGLGVHIPDSVLPFHDHYEAETEALPEPEGMDADTSDDVVSGPNVITDPDKPWFDLPTEAPADTSTSTKDTAPTTTTGGPTKNSGMTTGTRPVFNSGADAVSSVLPE